MKKEMKFQFDEFLEYTIEQLGIQHEKLLNKIYLKSLILDICGKALVLMINEKRKFGELLGKTPEERYIFFEEKFSKQGKNYQELQLKYPAIYHDLVTQVHTYVELVSQIKDQFNRDKQLLVINGLIHDVSEKIISLDVKGDFHNRKAVVKVTTNRSKLIYKPKSVKNDVFFYKFLGYLKKLGRSHVKNRSILDFYQLNILDRDVYGWVEFLDQIPVSSQKKVSNYYQRVGYLLSVAYMLNLTDLHFENIICKGEYPSIVDLETLFNVSIFKVKAINSATENVQAQIKNSVYATGMLPIIGNEQQFGGDTSGILGGSFNREERITIHPFRDDVQFKKKIIRQKFNAHIPFTITNNRKNFCNPYDYLTDITNGFSIGYTLFLENKEKIKSFIELQGKSVSTRILVRNTMEYSVLIQAAKSPVYVNKRKIIFEKLKKFNKGLASEIIESEISQLYELSIPFFMSKLKSNDVTDMNERFVCKLPISPYSHFLDKLNSFNLDDLKQQIKLIHFAIHSQEQLFKDGKSFSKYYFSTGKSADIDDSIQNLAGIIENNAFIGQHDQSINWMNLGVSTNEQIVFESLGNDIYKGLSGIGLSLLEYGELCPNQKTGSILKRIYLSVKKEFIRKLKIETMFDYSFYNGLIGELAFLKKYEDENHISHSNFSMYLTTIMDKVLSKKFELNDVIAGEAGLIIYLYGLNDAEFYKNQILHLGKKLFDSLNLEQSIASYAHGNSGIMTALLCVYQVSHNQEFLTLFFKIWENEKKLKLLRGWKDFRKQGDSFSTYWCHGAAGQALARMVWLQMNNIQTFLSEEQVDMLVDELHELMDIVLNEGMNEHNFCLCHGITGNLMIANFYQVHFDKDNKNLQKKITEHYYSICHYGLKKGWICGLGNEFYSYGMMTGISGILYALVQYKKEKSDLGVLLPNIR